jgi:hypothetical protein
LRLELELRLRLELELGKTGTGLDPLEANWAKEKPLEPWSLRPKS